MTELPQGMFEKHQKLTQGIIGGFFVLLFLWLALFPDSYQGAVGVSFAWSTRAFGWFWQLLVFLLFGVTIAIAASPLGKKRLGDQPPELGYFSWLAIILSTLLAGGGIFWSAAEPLYHLQNTPPTLAAQPGASSALAQSYFHWGFLAWTALGTMAIVPLQAVFRKKKLRNRPAALLYPVVPQRYLEGALGHVVDAVAVISALIGTIGPIGFLGVQLSYILSSTTPLPDSVTTQLILISLLAAVYTISAVRGIARGIRVLSILNMALCGVFGAFILLSINGSEWLSLVGDAFGTFLANFPGLTFADSGAEWTHNWTHFFWGWFLGYGPIMAIFLFKVSQGRTIREIFLTVALVAPLITNFWFSVVGGSGILLEQDGGAISAALNESGMPAALLAIIDQTSFRTLLIAFAIPLIFFFMATTGDSIALSVASIFSGDREPSKLSKVFWALAMAVIAAAVLVVGQENAISLFQQTIVVAAVPVSLIMLVASIAGTVILFRRRKGKSED
ncbi:MAG: BCCT family transporter [Bacteroidota bacterium]